MYPDWVAFCWLGEMALFYTNDVVENWSTNYQARAVVRALKVRREDFDSMLQSYPTAEQVVATWRTGLADKSLSLAAFSCARLG